MASVACLSVWGHFSTSAEGFRRSQLLSQALTVAQQWLTPKDIRSGSLAKACTPDELDNVETPQVSAAFALLGREHRLDQVYDDFRDAVDARFEWIWNDVESYTRRLEAILEEDANNSQEAEADDHDNAGQIIVDLLDRLALWQRTWGTPLKAMKESRRIASFTSHFHARLHSNLPLSFPSHLRGLLKASLSVFSTPAPGTGRPRSAAPSPHLSRLGILPRYSGVMSRVALAAIQQIAREEANKGWEARRLTKARQRVGEGVAGWLGGVFEGNEAAQQAIRPMFSRFDYNLCKLFFDIRTDELFDIIVDYPESMAALEDLKECLFKVDNRTLLVNKLNLANRKRLLHPGAETRDVVSQYISTIRSLRILDPPGVLLHKVAEPIRQDLRSRADTVKCIVSLLVEGEDSDDDGGRGLGLNDENESGGLMAENFGSEVERFGDPRWDPEPVDAAPEFRSGKANDLMTTLVSIFETRDAIIQELQILLASRLLAVKDYDAVKEIRIIEMLKIRFGEPALQVCDVMLKDMADSKRIDDRIQGDIQSTVHPLVISTIFWPGAEQSGLRLGPKLERAAIEYETAFHHFKPDKHLRWVQSLGTVHLLVELEDRVVDVIATPLQASLIELFEQQDHYVAEDLTERLGVSAEDVEGGLLFWSGEGVLAQDETGWWLRDRSDA